MRKPIAIGDMVKRKGTKKNKLAPIGIVVKVYEKDPSLTSRECEVLWLCSGITAKYFNAELSRITLDHV